MPMPDESWVTVATYGATYEADLAAGRLKSAGIPHRLDHRGGVGLFGLGHGGRTVRGIELLVPASWLDPARAALDLDEADE